MNQSVTRRAALAALLASLAASDGFAGGQTFCPASYQDEGEPNCGLDASGAIDDQTNGGCNASKPLFIEIFDDDNICGTFASNGEAGTRDTDWYSIVVDEPSRISWSLNSSVPGVVGLLETGGVPDCSGLTCFRKMDAGRCSVGLSTYVPPGEWWLFVAPETGMTVECGTIYRVSVQLRPAGDINNGGVVGPVDLAILLENWSIPAGAPGCDGDWCPADINDDGVVDAADLAILLGTWT